MATSLVLVTPPAAAPVSLAEAKAHLRVDHSDDDTLIGALIDAGVAYLDGWSGILGRALEAQTWMLMLAAFPACIRLPLGPVVADSVEIVYDDANGDEQTVDPSTYQVDAVGARVVLTPDATWPSTADTIAAVRVSWDAGTGCPLPVKQAILLLVGHWYANREAAGQSLSEMPFGVAALIAPFRRVGI